MNTNQQPDEIAVYIYTLDGVRDFWVAAGRQYARFAVVDDNYRFVRAQSGLPARALGYAVGMSRENVQALRGEAVRHGLNLKLRLEQGPYETHVYDRLAPAGVLTVDGFAFLSEEDQDRA